MSATNKGFTPKKKKVIVKTSTNMAKSPENKNEKKMDYKKRNQQTKNTQQKSKYRQKKKARWKLRDAHLESLRKDRAFVGVAVQFDVWGKIKQEYKQLVVNFLLKNYYFLCVGNSSYDPKEGKTIEENVVMFVNSIKKKNLLRSKDDCGISGAGSEMSLNHDPETDHYYILFDIFTLSVRHAKFKAAYESRKTNYLELRTRIYENCDAIKEEMESKGVSPVILTDGLNKVTKLDNRMYINNATKKRVDKYLCTYRIYFKDGFHDPLDPTAVPLEGSRLGNFFEKLNNIHVYSVPNQIRYAPKYNIEKTGFFEPRT